MPMESLKKKKKTSPVHKSRKQSFQDNSLANSYLGKKQLGFLLLKVHKAEGQRDLSLSPPDALPSIFSTRF